MLSENLAAANRRRRFLLGYVVNTWLAVGGAQK